MKSVAFVIQKILKSSKDITFLPYRSFKCQVIANVSKIKKSLQVNFVLDILSKYMNTFFRIGLFIQIKIIVYLRETFFSKMWPLEHAGIRGNISRHKCL